MQKEMTITGMMCEHCVAAVEKALNALDGVSASVDLASKTAKLTLTAEVSDEALTAAVEEEGYEVEAIR